MFPSQLLYPICHYCSPEFITKGRGASIVATSISLMVSPQHITQKVYIDSGSYFHTRFDTIQNCFCKLCLYFLAIFACITHACQLPFLDELRKLIAGFHQLDC